MSDFVKADGAKIKIDFNASLINDFTTAIGYAYKTPSNSTITASQYPERVANLTDNNVSTYWMYYKSSDTYIQIQYAAAKVIKGYALYTEASPCPTTIVFRGSLDGATWTDIETKNLGSVNGWQYKDVENETAYVYYRICLTAGYGSYISIHEIQMKEPAYNEIAFTVTVPEYDYVPGGSIQNVSKKVASVYLDGNSEDASSIILEMGPSGKFCSAVGNITVAYDGTGNLAGVAGAVEAFEETFTPSDLVWKGNQNDQEHIEISGIVAVPNLVLITFLDTSCTENISVSGITAVSALTHINDI